MIIPPSNYYKPFHALYTANTVNSIHGVSIVNYTLSTKKNNAIYFLIRLQISTQKYYHSDIHMNSKDSGIGVQIYHSSRFRNYAHGSCFVAIYFIAVNTGCIVPTHDDVIKWKHFPRYWPFCAGNSSVTGEFPAQRPVTRSFGVSLICALNKRLSKLSWGWSFETPSGSLWRHCNGQA